ncbi:short chain dehydrogenase [Legionella quinlivanii]|uniref:Short chain dehydrogenase n=2 Tax=Legionella quinlivanii TaxID=45073 RepID=A0A0W0Y6B2_9GAMM|nr:alpha/beta fold hydrolase [Legionella quinlivanii]KTD52492.1 short chain dehydrogenase [Legionella quinlivanii]SEG24281.1 Serine aminopeptidase, S33 [Legionella quinlivanii DSM 21216]STY09929.1 acetoin dehydrogenase E2 subunit dihydrolipoyllysine-residue acetyltransferase [Legionella quinlivanii]
MPEIDNTDLLPTLKDAIMAALHRYKTEFPRRAASPHRATDIAYLNTTVNTAVNPDSLLSELEDYFSSDSYYTGITDQSVLEALIVEELLKINKELQQSFNTFGYSPQPHPAKHETPEGAKDGNISLNYSLNDFIHYAIDKYISEKQGNIPQYRQYDIEKLRDILKGKQNDLKKLELIEEFLNGLTHPFNSYLKQYLRQSLQLFQSNPSKTFITRIWEPDIPSTPEKIMVFLHGWHDSVNSADKLAREAVKNGFKVIAYDHRGHGNDAQRQKRNISTDLLRIDFRKFINHINIQNPNAELALVGHSMGGAILTVENAFINNLANENGKAVKCVSLLAPAVMSGFHKMASPLKLFYRNMHPDVYSAQTTGPSPRFGGHGPSLFGLLNLMLKAARALKHLYQKDSSGHSHWHIYSGKKDASVNYSEFESLPNSHHKPVRFFSRGDHALQFGHRSGTVIRALIKDTEKHFSSTISIQPISRL